MGQPVDQEAGRAIGAEPLALNSHNVRLTPLGEQLRDDVRQLHQSLEWARLAARGKTGTLRVSLFPTNFRDLRRFFESGADVDHGVVDLADDLIDALEPLLSDDFVHHAGYRYWPL